MDAWNIGLSLRRASTTHANSTAARVLAPDGTAVVHEVTWAAMQSEVVELSRWLSSIPSMRRGDRVGILGYNSVKYLQLIYACVDAGIIFVPLNTRWSLDELRYAVVDSNVRMLAVPDKGFESTAFKLLGMTTTTWLLLGPSNPSARASAEYGREGWELLSACSSATGGGPAPTTRETTMPSHDKESPSSIARSVEVGPIVGHVVPPAENSESNCRGVDGVCCIVYTSGTTGRSKGVALTHIGQVMQAMAKCIHVGYDSSTTLLNVVPLFHVGGLSSTLAVTMSGGCHVFLPRFRAEAGVAAVPAAAVDTLVVVPTMLHMMLTALDDTGRPNDLAPGTAAKPSLAGVKTVLVGGQPLSARLASRARSLMPHATFIQTYACSEAGSSITFASSPAGSLSPGHGQPASGCEGSQAAVNVELRVVECGQGEDSSVRLAPAGCVGEVETRGPHVMKCYWGRPDLTRKALRADGWLRTGDLGRLDARTGRLSLVGRSKDVIKTGGENVHAAEVEGVLLRHSWVSQAAVYGVENERLGEQVVATVVLDAAGADCGIVPRHEAEAVLSSFCAQHLSPYKRPRRFEFVASLPRNSAGKVMRHILRSSL